MVAPGLLVYWFGSDLFYANIDRFFWVAGASRNPRFQLQSHPTVPRPRRRHVAKTQALQAMRSEKRCPSLAGIRLSYSTYWGRAGFEPVKT